jgi:hypothetical protein
MPLICLIKHFPFSSLYLYFFSSFTSISFLYLKMHVMVHTPLLAFLGILKMWEKPTMHGYASRPILAKILSCYFRKFQKPTNSYFHSIFTQLIVWYQNKTKLKSQTLVAYSLHLKHTSNLPSTLIPVAIAQSLRWYNAFMIILDETPNPFPSQCLQFFSNHPQKPSKWPTLFNIKRW